MEKLIIVVVIVLLLLFCTYKEHLELVHKHFPHSYYPEYINDLEVTGVRLLKPRDQKYRVPPHDIDMQQQFMVRDGSNIEFDLTQ